MEFLKRLLPLLNDPFILGALAALVAAAVLYSVLYRRTSWLSRIQRKALLTPNEVEFYRRLERALPAYRVFPQVSFGAFLTDDGKLSERRRWSVRARFDRKIADFVVCDARTLQIVALIELDDSSHSASADRARDAITKAGGYQTFRFQSRQKPSVAEIATLFQHAQAWREA